MFRESQGMYLTYQHNTQTFFREHTREYDGVIVPLSIASVFQQGTGGFILTLKKPFALDPRTPLFQASFDRNDLRSSHLVMAKIHGETLEAIVSERPLLPTDFGRDEIRECVRSILNFQMTFAETSQQKVERYARLLGEEPDESYEGPSFLIPPYFKFSSLADPWYRINQRAGLVAARIAGDRPVALVLHFPITFPEAEIDRLAADCAELPVGGLIVYVNDFQECQVSRDELALYAKIIRSLVNTDKPVLCLFGGYFTANLRKIGLRAFSNGVGYGEYRDSGYHAGGQAWRRYYLPCLHRFLPEMDAQAVLEKLPRDSDLWRTTAEVQEHLDAGETLLDLPREVLLRHFMNCRSRELSDILRESTGDLVTHMRETYAAFSEAPPIPKNTYSHLLRWSEALGAL